MQCSKTDSKMQDAEAQARRTGAGSTLTRDELGRPLNRGRAFLQIAEVGRPAGFAGLMHMEIFSLQW